MRKFFPAGLFLGAALTWAAMNYVVGMGLKGDEKEKALRDSYDEGKGEGEAEAKKTAEEEWQNKLDKTVAGLEKKQAERAAGLAKKVETLEASNRKLKEDLESAQEDVALANNTIEELRERLAWQTSAVLKELLVKAAKLRPVKTKVNREFAEACTVVRHALIGWPDVKLINKVAKEITELARQHRKLAQDVRLYIEQHSRGLKHVSGDLAPFRAGVQEQDIDAVDVLARKIVSAVNTMRTDSLVVDAKVEHWTDSEVFVERGDVIQVRAEGSWRMAASLPAAGPEGWDSGGRHKFYRDARAGGLILQIGISERVHPAYLGKPIVAEANGRVKFRMNDKRVRDNHGSVKVEVFSANPKLLRQVMEIWEAFKKF